MKTSTKVIVILGVLIIIGLILFTVDFSKVNNNKRPIFCVKTQIYADGASIEYIGFGYKVIKYVNLEDDTLIYKIGTWFMKFDNPLHKKLLTDMSPDISYMKFDSKNIQTHLYIDDFKSPSVDIIKSLSDLKKYKEKYKDDTLNLSLDKYTENYFKNKVLVIATIQESSGSNSDKVEKVVKQNDTNSIYLLVKQVKSEIGTADMAMWHLLVELNTTDFGDVTDVSVLDSNVAFL
jgi:hypothetical protein